MNIIDYPRKASENIQVGRGKIRLDREYSFFIHRITNGSVKWEVILDPANGPVDPVIETLIKQTIINDPVKEGCFEES